MSSCLRSGHTPMQINRRSRSVKIATPIVWQSTDQTKLRKKQHFIERLTFPQIQAILRDNELPFDESDTIEQCVDRLVNSQWIASRHSIDRYQRMRAKPIRTASQKSEDRLRLCNANNVENLSADEMKIWLTRRGGRVPAGDVPSEGDRQKMARQIRNRMRVTTPCFKAKAPPKRPQKGKGSRFIRRNANRAVSAPVIIGSPPRKHYSACEAKEPETPQIARFNAMPQTPQIAQNYRTPKISAKNRSALQTPSLMPMLSTLHESNEALLTTPMPRRKRKASFQVPATPKLQTDDDFLNSLVWAQ